MTKSSDLWQANQDLAQACLTHAFVRGIADGSMPRATFAYYVGQDAFFLNAFARTYSLAAAKTDTLEDFATFHALASGVLEELRLHQTYATNWGINLEQVKPGPATQRYTDFLTAIAWSQPIGVIAVAVAPCMRLYAFLGQQLSQQGIPQHTYSDWIKTYSSSEFEQLTQILERLIEEQASLTTTTHSTYRYAMRCELDFFEAAWEGEERV